MLAQCLQSARQREQQRQGQPWDHLERPHLFAQRRLQSDHRILDAAAEQVRSLFASIIGDRLSHKLMLHLQVKLL